MSDWKRKLYNKITTLSKKRFTQGFDLFFGGDEPAKETLVVEEVEIKTTVKKEKASPSNKKFVDGLESLFMEVLEEESKVKSTPKKAKKNKSYTGLDQLIRSTIDVSQMSKSERETKRLTILLEIEKIEALRKIAKDEKKRLKNVIREIVAEYLERKKND